MSCGIDAVDNRSIENLFSALRLPDFPEDCFSSVIDFSNIIREIDLLGDDQTSVSHKKKRKRIRPKKKKKRKEEKEEILVSGIQTEASTSSYYNQPILEISFDMTIKAITPQNCGFVFRKRNVECQYINVEYLTKSCETYMFDSRRFIKFKVLNESVLGIYNKTTLDNGIIIKNNECQINEVKNLQSSVSQGKAKKKKQKRIVSNKENKKVPSFPEYYGLEEVEEKLKLGELIKGIVRINPKSHNTAYVSNEDRHSQDYIINSVIDRNRALEGDVVILKLKPEAEWVENRKSASIVYILEKVHPRIAIGSLVVFYDKGRRLAALQPRDKRIPRIVLNQTSLPPMYFKNPSEHEGSLYMAKIIEWDHPKYAEGVIMEKIGEKNVLQNETTAILLENQLDVKPFPPSVYKYLPDSRAIPEKEFTYREDLRTQCIFTIDPLTARDLDDAVSCRNLPSGNLEVGVHIADVSFYLAENTELDEIVAKKGTTIYLVDNVYHMLPVELCLHCSLLPGKDCLAFSVFFEMTEDGKILNHRFARTVINSCAQLAYEHAQDMIDNKSSNNLPDIYNGYTADDLCDIVNKLKKISSNLRKKRFDNGALKIDQTKICFMLDAAGEPMSFFKYENIEAHRLIEELMLLANITVAERIHRDFPDLAFLRCHEPPNPRLMKEMQGVLENIGIHIDVSSSAALNLSLQNYSTPDYFGIARNTVLNHLFAKPMTRARYFCAALEDNYAHYALSVSKYTHFTSPIRRYADIMVHRLLEASLGYSTKPSWNVDYVGGIAENCNKQKYNAKKAGEASSDMFLAYYVERNQPFIQDAVVIDVREQSFHVMILNTGSIVRIYLNNLGDGVKYKTEKVEDIEKKLWRISILYGNNKQQMIEIFQVVKVQLKRKGNTFNLEGQLIQPD